MIWAWDYTKCLLLCPQSWKYPPLYPYSWT